jgi:DNA-binding CsgD family transcriptional regulator
VRADLRSDAEIVVQKCLDLAALNSDIEAWQAAADQALGLQSGDQELLQKAADRFEKCGRRLASALAGFDGVTLSGRRRPRGAAPEREQVVAALRAAGAIAIAEQLGGGRGGVSRVRRPATGWASLTPAELRVAELAAAGATNKEIAQQLWISPYTVDTHMRHTLAKLGLRSRVALAREFTAHGPLTGSSSPS